MLDGQRLPRYSQLQSACREGGGDEGAGSGSWRSSSMPVVAGRGRGGSGSIESALRPRQQQQQQNHRALNSGAGADFDEDSPMVASALRSFRSSLVGWSSRWRLRLRGGSSRLVLVNGVSYTLRTHLKTNKPKRSALRGSATPHSVSCLGCVENGEYGIPPASPSTQDGASLLSPAPSKKKLRFTVSVLDTDSGGSGTEAEARGDLRAKNSQEPPGKRGANSGDGADVGGERSDDDGAVSGREMGMVIAPDKVAKARVEAFSPEDSPPPAPDGAGGTVMAAAAVAAAGTAAAAADAAAATGPAASNSAQVASGSTNRGLDSSGVTGGSSKSSIRCDSPVTDTTTDAAPAGGVRPVGGWQSSSRRLLLRGGQPARNGQVHPDKALSGPAGTAVAPSAAPLAAAAGVPNLTERRQQAPQPLKHTPATDAAILTLQPPGAVAAPPPPVGPADGAVAAGGGGGCSANAVVLSVRPPSFLARLLLGARDSGASSGSGSAATPPGTSSLGAPRAPGSPSSDISEIKSDCCSSGAVVAARQQQQQPVAAPPPLPCRQVSAHVLQNALFEPETLPQPKQPPPRPGVVAIAGSESGGGCWGSGDDDVGNRTPRLASYTGPGMLTVVSCSGISLDAAAAVQSASFRLQARREFLPDLPRAAQEQRPEQQRQGQQQKEREDGGAVEGDAEEAEDECRAEAAAAAEFGRLRKRREQARRREEELGGGGEGRHCPAAADARQPPATWCTATSVRPIGDDMGDDVRDAAAGGDDSDDGAAFNWLEVLLKTRSMAGRWSGTAAEAGCGLGAAADDAEDLLQRLGRGSSLIQAPAPRLVAAGRAPVVRAGRRANGLTAVDMSFSDLSFSLRRAVQAVQGNSGSIVRQLQPGPPQQQQQAVYADGSIDSAAKAVATTAETANERSRRIRASPFATAMGLLRSTVPSTNTGPTAAGAKTPAAPAPPPPPPSPSPGARVSHSVSDRSGAVRWQLPSLPPPPPPQWRSDPPTSGAAMLSSSRNSSARAAAAANITTAALVEGELPDTNSTNSSNSTDTFLRLQRGTYVLVPGPQAPSEQFMRGAAASGSPRTALPPAGAEVAAEAEAVLDAARARKFKPELSESWADSSDGRVGGDGCGGQLPEPLTASPGAAAFVAATDVEQLMRRLGGGSGGVSAGRPSPGSQSGAALRSPSRNPTLSPGRSRAAAGVAGPAPGLSAGDLAFAPLNTPAANPWVEERTALAGSGTPFAAMATKLAQALAARMGMTSSGVGAASGGVGGGGGGVGARAASHSSQIRSAPFSAALDLLQQQRHHHRNHHVMNPRNSADLCRPACSPPSDARDVQLPGAAAAVGSFGRSSGGDGGGDVYGGYAVSAHSCARDCSSGACVRLLLSTHPAWVEWSGAGLQRGNAVMAARRCCWWYGSGGRPWLT